MFSTAKKIVFSVITLCVSSFHFHVNAAGLPQIQDPSRGAGSGILDTIKNHVYDGVVLVGLFGCAIAFMIVFKNCLTTYSQIQDGKKNWTDLVLMTGVGVILLVITIWLISEASDIL